jgi:hypothetical protein
MNSSRPQRSAASLARGLDHLDRALEALFAVRGSVLAKATGGDRRPAQVDKAINALIDARSARVNRIRAAGAGPLLLAKITASEHHLAKVSGLVGGVAVARQSARGGIDPSIAQRAFQRSIERTIAEIRPDEYHPERR